MKEQGKTADLEVLEGIRKVHLIGIGGTAMAALAGMFQMRGLRVTGSDRALYPPMSTFLAERGIPVARGFAPENIPEDTDLVVVGNVVRRDNPEAEAVRQRGLPFLSLPQALARFFIRGNRSIVVAGTHGKTTTSSLSAWVMEHAGMNPGFMIGGIVSNFNRNFQIGQGGFFVTEGDEYDTAYFDKGPKFFHYRPDILIVTGIEFDHADIYRDLGQIRRNFHTLAGMLPADGLLIGWGEDEPVRALLETSPAPVETYGLDGPQDWTARNVEFGEGRTRFEVEYRGEPYGRFEVPLMGEHNLRNTLAVVALSRAVGIDPRTLREGLVRFRGVRRRQEIRGERRGVMIMDDFAHHPTEVRETLRAVRAAYPGKRLVAVFEPRTNTSRRRVFQKTYVDAFRQADLVLVREPPDLQKIPPDERFSSTELVEDLRARGKEAFYFPDTDAVLAFLAEHCRGGDLVLILSNGGFDDIHQRLLHAL